MPGQTFRLPPIFSPTYALTAKSAWQILFLRNNTTSPWPVDFEAVSHLPISIPYIPPIDQSDDSTVAILPFQNHGTDPRSWLKDS